MWNTLAKIFKYSSEQGLRLPAAFDKSINAPSVSLLFAHLANTVALGSVIYLITQDAKSGCVAAISYSGLCMVLYLMRRLTNVKIDATDGELELSSGDGVGPGENNEEAK